MTCLPANVVPHSGSPMLQDPHMLREGFTTAALEKVGQMTKTSPVIFNSPADVSKSNDVIRQPSMVLRSRSARNMAEQADHRDILSFAGKAVRPNDDSKHKASLCKTKLFVFTLLLWCLVVAIVLHSTPWEDFEIRWVRKSINDVQWLYPFSRKECTVGQACVPQPSHHFW